MCAKPTDLDVLKNNVVTQMFVDPADQDYVVARWAYHRKMYLEFFWNACQSLEKYFKASLLLNRMSLLRPNGRNKYGHDLEHLFRAVSGYASDLFPEKLTKPVQWDVPHWREETLEEFISRMNELGDANNRYNVFGYMQRWEDLCHFDQMVFAARRVAFNLDSYPFIGNKRQPKQKLKTVRELLQRDPEKMYHRGTTSMLGKLTGKKADQETREAGLRLNYPFAPADYDHGSVRIGVSSSEAVLYRRIIALSDGPPRTQADYEGVALAEWVTGNVPLPNSVRDQISAAATKMRSRSET